MAMAARASLEQGLDVARVLTPLSTNLRNVEAWQIVAKARSPGGHGSKPGGCLPHQHHKQLKAQGQFSRAALHQVPAIEEAQSPLPPGSDRPARPPPGKLRCTKSEPTESSFRLRQGRPLARLEHAGDRVMPVPP